MFVAAEKGIDRAHGRSKNKTQIRLPLEWSMLWQGRRAVVSIKYEECVMWLELAVSYLLSCRASEL